jgi:hypothetical protein
MTNQLEERKVILKMIEDDKISAEEGLRLLESLGKESKPVVSSSMEKTEMNGHKFRVMVTNLNTGKPKVNVTIPMSLVNWGLRVGGRFSSEIEGIDLEELSEILKTSTQGKIIDVMDEEGGEHVEIFID